MFELLQIGLDVAFVALIAYLLFGKNAVATVTTARADVAAVENNLVSDAAKVETTITTDVKAL